MSKSQKPPPSSHPLPTPREPSVAAMPIPAYVSEAELPNPEPSDTQYEHVDDYAESAPEGEYAEQQYYDENGEPYVDENGQPYDPNYVYPEQDPHDPHDPHDPNAYAEPYAQEHTAPMEPPLQLHSHPPHIPIPAPLPPSQRIPIPASGPYRVPPVDQPMANWQPQPQPKQPRPILGSAIAVYGVLLWSFIVAGQFATSWISGAPLSQGTAAFFVFVATGTAWGFALHRSRHALPSVAMGRFIWRGIGIGAIAFCFFFLTLVGATIFGQMTHGLDFLIAFVLVATAMAAMIVGPRVTTPNRPARTHGMRFAVVSMWIVGVILTMVAGAELATNG